MLADFLCDNDQDLSQPVKFSFSQSEEVFYRSYITIGFDLFILLCYAEGYIPVFVFTVVYLFIKKGRVDMVRKAGIYILS